LPQQKIAKKNNSGKIENIKILPIKNEYKIVILISISQT